MRSTHGPAPAPAFAHSRRRRTAAILVPLLVILATSTPMAGWTGPLGPCPVSYVRMERGVLAGPFTVATTAYDSTYLDVYTAHVNFDRDQAHTFLSASSGGRMTASSRVVETFDITGVDPGTPVDAVMEFRLEGWAEQNCGGSGCGIIFEAALVVGSDSMKVNANQIGPGNQRTYLPSVITRPIHFVAGTPVVAHFYYEFGTGPGGGADAEVTGTYGVSGLPAGVQAVACPGAIVTPVRTATWGSVKQRYR